MFCRSSSRETLPRRVLAGLAALLALAGAGAGAESVSAVDGRGEPITLAAPAERIVALAPHLAENLYAAGAGDRLVGTVAYSDYPEAARTVPRIGAYNTLSLEAIVARRPDLVLAWGSAGNDALLRRLEVLGIPVFVDEIRSLAGIGDSLVAIGTLAGRPAAARAAAEALTAELAALGRAPHTPRLRVFYQIWHDPLQTVGGSHLISAVMALCGGDNVFRDLPALAPRVNRESVLARDPQVIIASGSGPGRPPWLDSWHRYPALSAVRRGALHAIDPALLQRATPRLVTGARRLCTLLDAARAGNRRRDRAAD